MASFDPPFHSSLVDQDISSDGNPRFFSAYIGDKSAALTGDKKMTLVAYDGTTRREVRQSTTTSGPWNMDFWDSVGGTVAGITFTPLLFSMHRPATFDQAVAFTDLTDVTWPFTAAL